MWLKREGSWRCPREYQRRQSEESRTTTLTSTSKMLRLTRQPWGTIVPPTFQLGHQKLPLKKIDNVVSRLYYVPKPKPLLGLEAQRRHSDLDKDTIDELVGIVHQYGLISLQNTVTVMTSHVTVTAETKSEFIIIIGRVASVKVGCSLRVEGLSLQHEGFHRSVLVYLFIVSL